MAFCACNENERKVWSLLVKPTHGCNFNCKYCYDEPHRKRLGNVIMSEEIHKHIVDLAAKHADKINWIYHGGEPLTVPMEWYKKVNEHFYDHFNKEFVLNMQSNGYLLTEEWAKFLKKYGISIGISFDLDSQNIRNDKSAEIILKNIKKAKEIGLTVGSITVINKHNYKKLIEFYEKSKEIFEDGVAFNTIYVSKGVLDNNLYFDINDFSKEFSKYLLYWIRDNSEESKPERSAIEAINIITGGSDLTCTYGDCRYAWIGVGPTGEVYPCDRYVPEKYYMGNILDYKSVDELYKSNGHVLYSGEVEERFNTHCAKCGYLKYCGGLCNANHVVASGSASGIDEFSCELFRQKFKTAYNVFRNLDIYEGKFNRHFVMYMLGKPAFTMKEIYSILVKNGIDITSIQYIPSTEKLLQCSEFKIFQIFNQYTRNWKGHSNFNKYKLEISAEVNKDFSFTKVKQAREKLLQVIFDDNKEEIRRVIYGF